jgi:hypothetical protein
METQLENKIYTVVDNIFSDKVLTMLEPYAKLLPSDKSSYSVWPAESTNNNTTPECFTCDVLGNDRLAVINELYNNADLPCYKKSWLKSCDIVVQKMPVGGLIPKHSDYCIFSLTVFLSEVEGGEFVWWDSNNNLHTVDTKYNTGVIACYNNYLRGASHRVQPVLAGLRLTLQLFVFDKFNKSDNTLKSVIIEE